MSRIFCTLRLDNICQICGSFIDKGSVGAGLSDWSTPELGFYSAPSRDEEADAGEAV